MCNIKIKISIVIEIINLTKNKIHNIILLENTLFWL